ncbi:hypothetical protein CHF44_06990 [Aeromonas veronii]|nr:hypothetical protein CHF44_06990 [Aeromonas veronii]
MAKKKKKNTKNKKQKTKNKKQKTKNAPYLGAFTIKTKQSRLWKSSQRFICIVVTHSMHFLNPGILIRFKLCIKVRGIACIGFSHFLIKTIKHSLDTLIFVLNTSDLNTDTIISDQYLTTCFYQLIETGFLVYIHPPQIFYFFDDLNGIISIISLFILNLGARIINRTKSGGPIQGAGADITAQIQINIDALVLDELGCVLVAVGNMAKTEQ